MERKRREEDKEAEQEEEEEEDEGRSEAAGVGAEQGALGRCEPSPWQPSQTASTPGDGRRSESSWTDLSTFTPPPPRGVKGQSGLI